MKFFGSFLILVLALLLQIYFGDSAGLWISFALVALITATFFLDLLGVIVLTLFAVLVLNWQPAPSWELAAFSGVPLLIFTMKKLSPLQPWLNNLLMVFLGVILSYLLTDFRFVFRHFEIFAIDVAAALIFGLLIFPVERAFSPD